MSSISHRELIKLSEARKPNIMDILKVQLSMPNTSLTIHVPCPNLDFPRWNLDVAHDYLTALFVGETLAQHCNDIEAHFEGLNTVIFVFNTKNIIDIEKFIENLIWLGKGFNDESPEINDGPEDEYDDGDDSDYIEFYEKMSDFETKIENYNLHFPELGDKYMANFIPGMEQVSGDVDLETIYFNHPERRYGFWKSCASGYLGYDFYVSSWAWIIPHDLNNENIYINLSIPIKKFGGFLDGVPNLQDAQRITINNLPPIIFNENVMACYPLKGVRSAQECSAAIWHSRFKSKSEYTNQEATRSVHNLVSSDLYLDLFRHKINTRLSEDGYILVASDSLAQYVFFKEEYYGFRPRAELENERINSLEEISDREMTLWTLPPKNQGPFWTALDKISETLGKIEGNPIDIKLDWNKFDDEKFESLCYEIARMSEKFNPETARKMGKSRSRDGGRDIEIFTRQRINNPEKKWIIQCKFSKGDRALSASKVSISDVIDEYQVQGFCVMTNTLIDSTLHDRLGRISQHRSIEFDEWDILRIERTLSRPRYRNIMKRYFR